MRMDRGRKKIGAARNSESYRRLALFSADSQKTASGGGTGATLGRRSREARLDSASLGELSNAPHGAFEGEPRGT